MTSPWNAATPAAGGPAAPADTVRASGTGPATAVEHAGAPVTERTVAA